MQHNFQTAAKQAEPRRRAIIIIKMNAPARFRFD
jgi:hypothetical protein